MLAANADGKTDDQEKNTAIAFEHTKTYTADPLLGDFYEHSEQLFRQSWQELDNELPKGKEKRDQALKQRLSGTEKILGGSSKKYQTAMHKRMQTFKEHVSRAHYHVLEDFIFPVPISGLNA